MREIVTERLILRPFAAEDLSAFAAYRSAPEVARFQSWDSPYPMAEAERFLASQQGVELGTPGAWVQLAAVGRDDGWLRGDCAVRVADDQPATAEVGVTFAPAAQGSGLATEALAAVVTRLFEDHGLHRVYARGRRPQPRRPPPLRALGLPLRGAPRGGRLVQGRVVHAAGLRGPAA